MWHADPRYKKDVGTNIKNLSNILIRRYRDYLFYISDPSITNAIKDYEVYSPSKGTEERDRLYKDFPVIHIDSF